MKPMNDHGHALVAAVVSLTILITLGTGLLTLTATEKKISANSAKSAKAFYLAEGGLNYAIANLRGNPSWRVTNQTASLGEGNFTLTVENGSSPQTVKVISKGTVGNVTRTVVAEVLVPSDLFFVQAITSFGDSGQNSIGQHTKINGDILSNQSINIGQQPEIEGWVTTNGQVTGPGAGDVMNKTENAGVSIPGPVEPVYPQRPLPTWEENWFLKEGLGEPVIINGNVTSANVFKTGKPYFQVNGNVNLDTTDLSGVTIVASGSISIGRNSTLSQVTLKAGTSLTVGQKSEISNATLVADSTLTVEEDTKFSGIMYSGANMNIQQKLEAKGNLVLYSGGTFTLGQEADFAGFNGEIYSSGDMNINQKLKSEGALVIVSGGDLTLGQGAELSTAEIYSNGDELIIDQKLEVKDVLVSAAGNLELGQQAKVSGEIYSQGKLAVEQQLESDGLLALVAGGDITIGQQSQFQGIIYSKEKLTANQQFEFTGSIFVAEFNLGQQTSLTYKQEIVQNTPVSGIGGGGSGISLTSWAEQ